MFKALKHPIRTKQILRLSDNLELVAAGLFGLILFPWALAVLFVGFGLLVSVDLLIGVGTLLAFSPIVSLSVALKLTPVVMFAFRYGFAGWFNAILASVIFLILVHTVPNMPWFWFHSIGPLRLEGFFTAEFLFNPFVYALFALFYWSAILVFHREVLLLHEEPPSK